MTVDFRGGERKIATTIFQRPGLNRAWGDGDGDQREHVIVDVKSLIGAIRCRCGAEVWQGTQYLTLEQAWDDHRGLGIQKPTTHKAEDMATDAEVSDFLARIEDPGYHPIPRAGGLGVTRQVPDIEDAEELVARLMKLGDTCTCTDDSDIRDCPNYVDGDENE